MTEHIHDCVVVGAGPAGAAAALQLARDGLDVVLLERGDRPGEKNVMSGILFTDTLAELVPDFAHRAPLQRRITNGYAMHYLTADAVVSLPTLRDYREPPPQPSCFTVFRSQFDAWFAEQAVKAGAELFTATLVEDLLWEDGRVTGVRTVRGDLQARVVIGADGVNSTVAEKSGLRAIPAPTEVSLIAREVLDLPAGVIEQRFVLRPGEGILNLFIGLVSGEGGRQGVYFTELYTNQDSLSLTSEVRLNTLQECGVPAYEVMAARERHPYIARLIEGCTLREYQAHLIPWGGVDDLGDLYGDGVLLAGDAGKFTTEDGVGSWPAMASGKAAARAVKHACERGDFSRETLSAYVGYLDEEGMVQVQRQARREWSTQPKRRRALDRRPAQIVALARRYFGRWRVEEDKEPYSLWGQAYHTLIKPLVPWHVRGPLGLAAWVDTLRWRQQRGRRRRRERR
jgi:electron transfer flavoprotein-quinone oxidoreductase